MIPKKPVSGLTDTPTVYIEDLDKLVELVDLLADAKVAKMRRDVRLAQSLHTLYTPGAQVVPGTLSQDAMRRFGERVRLT